jgi:hypothetical protein
MPEVHTHAANTAVVQLQHARQKLKTQLFLSHLSSHGMNSYRTQQPARMMPSLTHPQASPGPGRLWQQPQLATTAPAGSSSTTGPL